MQISLGSTQTIITQPVQTLSLSAIEVERFVDIPEQKAVYAFVRNIGRVRIDALSNVTPSDNNYDNPEWSNASAITALVAQINAAIAAGTPIINQ